MHVHYLQALPLQWAGQHARTTQVALVILCIMNGAGIGMVATAQRMQTTRRVPIRVLAAWVSGWCVLVLKEVLINIPACPPA